jgi:hypothetical protein
VAFTAWNVAAVATCAAPMNSFPETGIGDLPKQVGASTPAITQTI